MNVWPVVGQPMPDTIATFTVGGVDYIATANEGDAVEYGVGTANEFACEERGGLPDMLDESIDSCELSAALKADSMVWLQTVADLVTNIVLVLPHIFLERNNHNDDQCLIYSWGA